MRLQGVSRVNRRRSFRTPVHVPPTIEVLAQRAQDPHDTWARGAMFCPLADLCFNAATFDLLLGSTALLLGGLNADIDFVQRRLERHWAARSIAWQRNAAKVHEMILSHHTLAVLRQLFLVFLRGKSAWMVLTDVHDVLIASHHGTAGDSSVYRDAPLTLSLDVSCFSHPCQ